MEIKECRYHCGKKITFLGKTEQPNSTGYYEVDEQNKLTHIEHTYAVCNAILEEKAKLEKTKQEHGGGLESFDAEAREQQERRNYL